MSLSEEDKLAALRAALAGAALNPQSNAGRLLDYIVAANIEGREDGLSPAVLAQEVLGRGPDFDPNRDSAVRVEIKRLRDALERYYRTHGATDMVRIAIPTGRYVAEFTDLRAAAAAKCRKKRRAQMLLIALAFLAFAALSSAIAYLSLSLAGPV